MNWGAAVAVVNSAGQSLGFEIVSLYIVGAVIITLVVSALIAGIVVAADKSSSQKTFFEVFKDVAKVVGLIFFALLALSSC